MKLLSWVFWCLLFVTLHSMAFATDELPLTAISTSTDVVELSTTPVGSSFMRHLAADFDQDVKMLAKFEKRGFGRAETITLMLIAQKQEKPIKDVGNERLKEKRPLREMAEKAGLNYDDLLITVNQIKKDIEEVGDSDLPPPVFEKKEVVPEEPSFFPKKKKAEDKKQQ